MKKYQQQKAVLLRKESAGTVTVKNWYTSLWWVPSKHKKCWTMIHTGWIQVMGGYVLCTVSRVWYYISNKTIYISYYCLGQEANLHCMCSWCKIQWCLFPPSSFEFLLIVFFHTCHSSPVSVANNPLQTIEVIPNPPIIPHTYYCIWIDKISIHLTLCVLRPTNCESLFVAIDIGNYGNFRPNLG